MTPIVDYLVARDGPPARSGAAFDYLLGGDGLYVAAENDHLAVRAPVARCAVRGLPPLFPACALKHGRLPAQLWERVVRFFRVWHRHGREVLLAVLHDAERGYRLTVPPQIGGPDRVVYAPPADVVLAIHSHRGYPAFFSATDDADEQGLCLYGAVGRLDDERPEVALRAGVYGHFLPVPWETVFEGDPAAVVDVTLEDADELEQSDDLRDRHAALA